MYNAYFGFREKPFNVTPDPRFFYANPIYQEAYASLVYGIKERKGFIMLTGEVGTGKTTLLRRLMNNMEATARFVFFYNTTLTFEELVTFVCEELGLETKGGERLKKIQALNEFLIEQLKKDGTVVLLIDEAQNLADDALENLRLLSNLETSSEKLLQIVLVGQPEMEAKLDQPGLRQIKQRIAVRYRLDHLRAREVGPYIEHRLQLVGYQGPSLFASDAIERIASYSNGVPRLINIICDNTLLIAYGGSNKTVNGKMVEEAARDLRLAEKREEPTTERAPLAINASKGVSDHRAARSHDAASGRPLTWAAAAIFLLLIFLGATGAVLYPMQSDDWLTALHHKTMELLSGAEQAIEGLSQNLTSELFAVSSSTSGASKAPSPLPSAQPTPSLPDPQVKKNSNVKVEPDFPAESVGLPILNQNEESQAEPRPQREIEIKPLVNFPAALWRKNPVVIEEGTTIYTILLRAYGDYNTLAMDLIKEFNPHIKNLNWVIAGQFLWLPPLNRDTLLRKQPDDSYYLILASPPYSLWASELAQAARSEGFRAEVTPRRVSDSLSLHRVEIVGLMSLEDAHRAWDVAVARQWIPLAEFVREARILRPTLAAP